jgi:DNA topoisomerase VI subunit A
MQPCVTAITLGLLRALDQPSGSEPLKIRVSDSKGEGSVDFQAGRNVVFTRCLRILKLCQELVFTGRSASKRDCYYVDTKLFISQGNFDTALLRMCSLMRLTRFDLNIFAGKDE